MLQGGGGGGRAARLGGTLVGLDWEANHLGGGWCGRVGWLWDFYRETGRNWMHITHERTNKWQGEEGLGLGGSMGGQAGGGRVVSKENHLPTLPMLR